MLVGSKTMGVNNGLTKHGNQHFGVSINAILLVNDSALLELVLGLFGHVGVNYWVFMVCYLFKMAYSCVELVSTFVLTFLKICKFLPDLELRAAYCM